MKLCRRLSRALAAEHPDEAAQVLEALDSAQAAAVLEELGLEAGVAVLPRMEPVTETACVRAWSPERVGELIAALAPDHAARILSRMEPSERDRIVAQLSGETAEPLLRLLDRPEGTAAALMDPRPPTLPADITVAEARKLVQRHTRDLQYYLYVVDRQRRLVGVVNLRQLLVSQPKQPLLAVMRAPVKRLATETGWKSIIAHPGWRDFHAMPVVDSSDVLVGVLRYETLRRLESDATRRGAPGVLAVSLAIGEVYWDIATRLLQETLDLAAAVASRPEREAPDGK